MIFYLWVQTAELAIYVLLNILNISYLKKNKSMAETLGLSSEDIELSLSYTTAKTRFGIVHQILTTPVKLLFIAFGGLGLIESLSFIQGAPIVFFFGWILFLSFLLELPFELYQTFVLEEKFGFNRQTLGAFFIDRAKITLISIVVGVPLLFALGWAVMLPGGWFYTWLILTFFSVGMLWLFPTFIAPLFNRFSPLEDQSLKEKIAKLAQATTFPLDSVYVMDASKRSGHGNAYFTGFGKAKRIVFFDNLLKILEHREIVAVLAHELGHFKLGHIRWRLLSSFLITFVMLASTNLFLDDSYFFTSFGLEYGTSHGRLLLVLMWIDIVGKFWHPVATFISRANEFEADRFAGTFGPKDDLASALLRLREHSRSMPVAHPWYSRYFYSHPPLLERLQAIRQ